MARKKKKKKTEDEPLEDEPKSKKGKKGKKDKAAKKEKAPKKPPKPKKPSEPNPLMDLILCVTIGWFGIDRLMKGHFILGGLKLVGAGVAGTMLLAGESTGLDPSLAQAIGMFALIGVLGVVELHDIFVFGMAAFEEGEEAATVYCSSCGEIMEVNLQQKNLQGLVCRYPECGAQAPAPSQDVVKQVHDYCQSMVSNSVFAAMLLLGTIGCLLQAFFLSSPDASGKVSPDAETGMMMMLGGAAVMFLLMLWQMAAAEKRKPIIVM